VELLGWRSGFAGCFHLSPRNLVHHLNATQQDLGASEKPEPYHGPGLPFDGTVILLNNVVEKFPVLDLEGPFTGGVDDFECSLVDAALVNRNNLGFAISSCRYFQFSLRSGLAPVNSLQEVDIAAVLVGVAMTAFPFAIDLDVGFVPAPALADRALVPSKGLLQQRQQLRHPAIGVINRDASLGRQLIMTARAQRMSHVSAHSQQDHVKRIVQSFEYLLQAGIRHCVQHSRSSILLPPIQGRRLWRQSQRTALTAVASGRDWMSATPRGRRSARSRGRGAVFRILAAVLRRARGSR
jgi:hypothetical protein